LEAQHSTTSRLGSSAGLTDAVDGRLWWDRRLELTFAQPGSEFTLVCTARRCASLRAADVPMDGRRLRNLPPVAVLPSAAGSFLLFFPDVELTHTVSRQQRQRHVAFDSS
jgi:hypothetical protein